MSRVALSLILLLAATARGEWKRYVFGPEREGPTDSPPAHRMEYFRMHPCKRPDLPNQCPLEPSKEELEARKKMNTKLRTLGTADTWTVHEFMYEFPHDSDATLTMRMQSILVETATDELHEIFNSALFYEQSPMFPAKLFLDGQTAILLTDFEDDTNYHYVHKHFFVIDKTGVTLLDFAPVELLRKPLCRAAKPCTSRRRSTILKSMYFES